MDTRTRQMPEGAGAAPMTAQQPEPLLDIRERPNGSVVIKRYPFETVFNSDEVKELEEYFHTRPHTPAPELTFKQPDMQSGYTVEQVAEIDKRIRKERAEAARTATLATLDRLDEFLNSDDHLSLFKWEVREQIRAIRAAQEPHS